MKRIICFWGILNCEYRNNVKEKWSDLTIVPLFLKKGQFLQFQTSKPNDNFYKFDFLSYLIVCDLHIKTNIPAGQEY